MNFMIIVSGVAYTLLSLCVGLATIFITFSFLRRLHKGMVREAVLDNQNIALALYMSASIFSVSWVMKGALEPAIAAFNLVLRNPSALASDFSRALAIMGLQLVISGFLAFGFVLIGLWIFTKLTRDIQEMTEIQNNNMALGILLSTVIIVLVLFMEPGIGMVLDGMVPFPEIGLR